LKIFFKTCVYTAFLWGTCTSLPGQIAPGQWRDHLPYSAPFRIALTPNRTWAATKDALFSYHQPFHTVEKLSRVHGLNDMDISCFEYIPEKNILFVGYQNGNIDMIVNGEIQNLADIKRYTGLTGNKQINHALYVSPYLYLSTGFGIVVVNPEKKEMKDTYYIGPMGSPMEVFQMAIDGTYLYAATTTGVFRAPKDDPNLINYAVWETLPGLPEPDASYSFVLSLNTTLLTVRENGLEDIVYLEREGSWEILASGMNVRQARTASGQFLLVTSDGILFFDEAGQLSATVDDYGTGTIHPADAVPGDDLSLWIADNRQGMIHLLPGGASQQFVPNGPLTSDAWHVAARSGQVYVSGGGLDAAWNNVFLNGAVYAFHEEQWESMVNYSVRDIIRTLIDPADPDHFWSASWGYGVLEYRGNQLLNVYNDENSTLLSVIPGEKYIRIGGMALDRERNLWVTNSGVSRPVSVLTPDGWKGLDYPINAPTLGDILVTSEGHKWVLLPRGYGLFAFNDMNTPENTDDDLTRKFSLQDETGNTITSEVFSMAEDRDGNIWVGSSMGPVVYYNPEQVFSGDHFYASRIKIPGETPGQADYLLGNETITTIAVDGGNRKWLGTLQSGAYLVSPEGTREIVHFTTDNSPLLSNHILSIGVDDRSGEVFFATSKGLVSYRGDATGPADYFSNVYVFPNPVREDFAGPVTITGLVEDTWVKITDIAGELVYETRSVGGQAIWNGKNLRGERVSTGVYLVFLTNEDGSQTHVTKLLFIH